MKKLLFCALALTLIFALSASATLTRVLTLGDANNIVKDEANILLYPSTITLYRALVLGEVDGAGLYKVGAHYDFGADNCVFGVYLDKTPLGFPLGAPNPQPANGGVDNRLNLFWGRPFGEIPFGAALSLYHDSYKDEASSLEQSNTDLRLQLGATLMEKLDIAAGFSFGTFTNKDSSGADLKKPESIMGFNLGGRYWYGFNDEVDFIPHLAFAYSSEGYKDAADKKTTNKDMNLDLGWGVNVRPVDRVLLIFDLGIMYDNLKQKDETVSTEEQTTTTMNLPYYKVGLEGHVTKWWDVRLGAVKMWHNYKQKDVEGWSDGTTDTYLGSGFHFGNLTLDAWLDPAFVLNGPNFVSGYTGNLAYMASIKYAWK